MNANDSIRCNVDECKHHAAGIDQCTLDSVCIGKCGCDPKTKEGTDCESFDAK